MGVTQSINKATSSLILEDPGAWDNFIVLAFTEELELLSEPVTAGIKMPGEGHKAYQARIYLFQIEDMTKEKHTFNAELLALGPTIKAQE